MRFILRKQKEKTKGQYRIIRRFALFPIKIKNVIIWLEPCYIKQQHWESWDEHGWENIEFVTIDQYVEYYDLINDFNNT
jgi:hypothetical protein